MAPINDDELEFDEDLEFDIAEEYLIPVTEQDIAKDQGNFEEVPTFQDHKAETVVDLQLSTISIANENQENAINTLVSKTNSGRKRKHEFNLKDFPELIDGKSVSFCSVCLKKKQIGSVWQDGHNQNWCPIKGRGPTKDETYLFSKLKSAIRYKRRTTPRIQF
jgi:hypothetical protein